MSAGSASPPPSWRRGRALSIGLLACALLLPFAGKPFHVDDPLFVWAGEALARDPLRPYAGVVNWYERTQPMHEVMWNPPAVPYYAALVGALFGSGEVALHLAFLLPALLFVAATYGLAVRWCWGCGGGGRPALATLAAALSPAFLVSATNVMADVTMAALFVSSLLCWVDGIDRSRRRLLGFGAVLAGACALSKYAGLAVLPLFALYAWLRRARLATWLPFLLVPLALLGAWEILMRERTGAWPLEIAGRAAAAAAKSSGSGAGRPALEVTAVALAFLGGSALAPLGLILLAARRKALLLLGSIVLVSLCVALRWDSLVGGALVGEPSPRSFLVALELVALASLALAGLFVAARRLARVRSRAGAVDAVLGLWVVEVLVFAACLNWSTTARAFLPALPALAILACRALDAESPHPSARMAPPRRAAAAALLVLAAAVSLSLNVADHAIASSARRAAQTLVAQARETGRQVWFQGHWGFQYYAERAGARPMEKGRDLARSGDRILVPMLNTNVLGVPREEVRTVRVLEHPLPFPLTTLGREAQAGFYGSVLGILPYGCAFGEPSVTWVFERR